MLSYDGLVSTEMLGNQIDNTLPAAHASKKKVLDALRVRDGYVDAAGTPIAATKPTLKIVLVQQTTRPAIVKPFIQGMKTLNERAGCNYSGTDDQKYLCYPVISDEANIVQAPPFNGVDAFLADFGAWDRAVLDFVFNKNVPAGFPYGTARLPIEIPSTDAAVRAQYEDVPNDSSFPTYYHGAGSLLPPN
jgi:hypothetical protein